MKSITVHKKKCLKGEFYPPGDKSISHRTIMLGSIADGKTHLTNFCSGEDTLRTVQAFQSLGIKIERNGTEHTVWGKGLNGLQEPQNIIDAGNSGTTVRLITGLLSGQNFFSAITGDASLRSRPMKRITDPMRAMGAKIDGRGDGNFVPLSIRGGALSPIQYQLPVASAQVKSAILLGGLYADGITEITEPVPSRDHTERMLSSMGATIEREKTTVRIKGSPHLKPFSFRIPGDISSAAFLIVGAILLPGSHIVIRKVGVNLLRTGILEILKQMGANIEVINPEEECGELTADVVVKSSSLKGVNITGDIIPRTIDEIPVVAVAAAHAEGTTIIRNAKELRVKETDRIAAVVKGLKKFGVKVEELSDGMAITGQKELKGASVFSYGDHRIAMAFIIAGLTASEETTVVDTEPIETSFPQFMESLDSLLE
ncbi:MAG: 3-phosphoshikimate 1-carboxyvinyltransferase [Proteobacteria bacterium]|nr:3-phosphoshikimate 1-carboxyvinyltransferase [Pseudomonadota bacterium]